MASTPIAGISTATVDDGRGDYPRRTKRLTVWFKDEKVDRLDNDTVQQAAAPQPRRGSLSQYRLTARLSRLASRQCPARARATKASTSDVARRSTTGPMRKPREPALRLEREIQLDAAAAHIACLSPASVVQLPLRLCSGPSSSSISMECGRLQAVAGHEGGVHQPLPTVSRARSMLFVALQHPRVGCSRARIPDSAPRR